MRKRNWLNSQPYKIPEYPLQKAIVASFLGLTALVLLFTAIYAFNRGGEDLDARADVVARCESLGGDDGGQ